MKEIVSSLRVRFFGNTIFLKIIFSFSRFAAGRVSRSSVFHPPNKSSAVFVRSVCPQRFDGRRVKSNGSWYTFHFVSETYPTMSLLAPSSRRPNGNAHALSYPVRKSAYRHRFCVQYAHCTRVQWNKNGGQRTKTNSAVRRLVEKSLNGKYTATSRINTITGRNCSRLVRWPARFQAIWGFVICAYIYFYCFIKL